MKILLSQSQSKKIILLSTLSYKFLRTIGIGPEIEIVNFQQVKFKPNYLVLIYKISQTLEVKKLEYLYLAIEDNQNK